MRKRSCFAAFGLLLALVSAHSQGLYGIAQAGTPQDMQAAIDKGANVNEAVGGMTPLIIAAWYNKDPEVITMLVKAGADIEARDSVHGKTALLWAAYANPNPEVTAALLKAGADLEARDKVDGMTALMWAIQFNKNLDVITVLLNAGADAKAKDQVGLTTLDYAQARRNLKGTDVLRKLEEASR